jgi:queuosine precursor transporter
LKANLQIQIGDAWQPKYLGHFGMVLVGLMLTTSVLNLKFVDVFGATVIGSELTHVFSLILADVMAEVYGYRRVRKILYLSVTIMALYAAAVQVMVVMPPAPSYTNNAAYGAVLGATPRIVTASLVSYLVAELINSFIMSRLKVKYTARFFYGRAIASVGSAQLINGALFFGMAFLGVMPLPAIVSAAGFSWLIVMGTEIVILPLTKKLADRFKLLEGVEHYDEQPAEMPESAITT